MVVDDGFVTFVLFELSQLCSVEVLRFVNCFVFICEWFIKKAHHGLSIQQHSPFILIFIVIVYFFQKDFYLCPLLWQYVHSCSHFFLWKKMSMELPYLLQYLHCFFIFPSYNKYSCGCTYHICITLPSIVVCIMIYLIPFIIIYCITHSFYCTW